MSVERRSAGKFCARAAAVCGVLARCAVSPNTRNIVSISSIYYLYTGQSAGCRPIKGLMRLGSGLQDPAAAPGVYLPAHTPSNPHLAVVSWA